MKKNKNETSKGKEEIIHENNKIILSNTDVAPMTATLDQDILNKATKWEDFISLWTVYDEIEVLVQWCKGDLACKVAIKYGEGGLLKFAQELRCSYSLMIAYRRTSRAFDFNNRLLKVSWTHHYIASQVDIWNKDKQKFEGANRFKWIEKAHDENWSVARLKLQIAEHKAKEDKNLFQYYSETINRFGNIIGYWHVEELDEEQKNQLFISLDKVINNFKNLFRKSS